MSFLRHIPRWDVWTTAHGRLGRLQYFLTCAMLIIPAIVIGALATTIISTDMMSAGRDSEDFRLRLSPLTAVSLIALYIPVGLLVFYAQAKRLHDLGMPAVIALAFQISPLLVGIVIVWLATIGFSSDATMVLGAMGMVAKEVGTFVTIGIGAYLFMAPGERGANKYGPDPLQDQV